MNSTRKRGIFFSFAIIVLLTTVIVISNHFSIAQQNQNHDNNLSGYTTSYPLIIVNDSDLAGNASSGDGSIDTPYIIENLLILTTDPVGILIGSTTKNFIIRDCYILSSVDGIFITSVADNTVELENNTIYSSGDNIHIESTNYVNITKNYLTNNDNGIFLENVDYCNVDNNTCTACGNGIYAHASDYGNYTENVLTDNVQHGIMLHESDNCITAQNNCSYNEFAGIYSAESLHNRFEDNICQNNKQYGINVFAGLNNSVLFNKVSSNDQNGISINTSPQNNIINNTVHYNGYHGINLISAFEAIIVNNTLTNDGFQIQSLSQSSYQSLTFSSNFVNDKPLGFFHGLGEITLTGDTYGQLFLGFCSGTMIQNYTIHNTSNALRIIGGDGITIDNCNFEDNYYGGIELHSTTNCTITNSKCSTNYGFHGIYGGGLSNITIFNCTAENNAYGIILESSSDFNITSCSFDDNYGPHIFMLFVTNGIIKKCGFTNGLGEGIEFFRVDYVNISYNYFENNMLYAIFLDTSEFNRIHLNAFISNNDGGSSQAWDNSANLNLWYDPVEMAGNYWDDWSGIGEYSIMGGFNNDSYPLGSIPPGVVEFNQIPIFFVFLIPILVITASIKSKRKK